MGLEAQGLATVVDVGYFTEADTVVSGVGFEPSHIEFYAMKHGSLNSEQNITGGLPFSMGYYDGDTQVVGGVADNSDSVDSHYQYFGTGDVIYVIDTSNAGNNRNGALTGSVSGTDGDGFSINYSENNAGSVFIAYRAFG